jgi:hypothetical protein
MKPVFFNGEFSKLKKILFLAVFFMLAAFVVFRPINHDETYYLVSSQMLVEEGKLPYLDFVFHQMPLMILVYAPVSVLSFWGLIFGRVLSCLFIISSFYLLFKTIQNRINKHQKLLFFSLFWFNLFLFDWGVPIKVYAFSIFLISLALFYYSKYISDIHNLMYLFITALLFSLLIFTKISFAVNYLVLFLFTLYITYPLRKDIGYAKVFAALVSPFLAGVVIFILIFQSKLDLLYFNLIYINSLYKDLVPFLLNLRSFLPFFILPQNLILTVMALFSIHKVDKFRAFLMLNVISYILINIPTRMLAEYGASILPLIIILAVFGYDEMLLILKKTFEKISPEKGILWLVMVYCFISPLSLYQIRQIIFREKTSISPLELHSFVQSLDSIKGKTVMSSWEGLSLFSDKQTVFKDNYAISYVSDYLDDKVKAKYKLVTRSDYKMMVNNAYPDLIVFDNDNASHLWGMEAEIRQNYKIAFTYKSIVVYKK